MGCSEHCFHLFLPLRTATYRSVPYPSALFRTVPYHSVPFLLFRSVPNRSVPILLFRTVPFRTLFCTVPTVPHLSYCFVPFLSFCTVTYLSVPRRSAPEIFCKPDKMPPTLVWPNDPDLIQARHVLESSGWKDHVNPSFVKALTEYIQMPVA